MTRHASRGEVALILTCRDAQPPSLLMHLAITACAHGAKVCRPAGAPGRGAAEAEALQMVSGPTWCRGDAPSEECDLSHISHIPLTPGK